MTESEPRDAFLHGPEEEQLADYSAVSVLAVIALMVGLASPLALIGISLWFVPALGIAVGLAALWRINHSQAALVGGWMAVLGLMLAICFAAWAPAQYFARRGLLAQQAHQAADRWFDLVREGRLQEAHQWMLSAGARAPRNQDLDTFYVQISAAGDQLVDFEKKPFVVRMQNKPPPTLTFLETTEVQQEQGDYVILRYRLAPSTPAESPLTIQVRLDRFEMSQPYRVYWQVSRAEVVDDE